MTEVTRGEIRKRVEIKLHRELGLGITPGQVSQIRELAPLVAEGNIRYADAVLEIENL